ncbi:MAG: hypothetical protein NVS4B10_11730 [Myxococcales bacterium]
MAGWREPTKRWAALGALPLAIAACAVLLVCGAFVPSGGPLLRQTLCWAVLVAAGLAAALRQLLFTLRGEGPRAPLSWSVEAALLLAIGALALTQLTGAVQSPLAPLIYLLGAGYVLALPLPAAVGLIATLVALDASLIAAAPPALPVALALRNRWPLLASHAGFTILFASLYHALLAARMRRADRAERDAVSRRVAEAHQRAREMRLVATSEPNGDEREPAGASSTTVQERQLLSAVAEVEEALCGALAIAEAALKPNTVAVFLLAPDGETVRLRECLSKSDRLLRGPLPSQEGALGAVLQATPFAWAAAVRRWPITRARPPWRRSAASPCASARSPGGAPRRTPILPSPMPPSAAIPAMGPCWARSSPTGTIRSARTTSAC